MLSSMTGFGAASDELRGFTWHFEAKSVNGRGLDMRLNLPTGCESLEAPIRALLKAKFARGNFQSSLTLREAQESSRLNINTALLTSLARRTRLLDRAQSGRSVTRAADLITIKGVLSSERSSPEISADSETGMAIIATVGKALDALDTGRKNEGKALEAVLMRVVLDMEAEVQAAKQTADAQPANMLARLKERVAGIIADAKLSEERLEQEVAILVTKADITEELDRLDAHLKDARRMMNSDEAVGRKLDFLSQELLREANTLGSKAASLEMTRHSLSLKGLIDQFKEQAANVE